MGNNFFLRAQLFIRRIGCGLGAFLKHLTTCLLVSSDTSVGSFLWISTMFADWQYSCKSRASLQTDLTVGYMLSVSLHLAKYASVTDMQLDTSISNSITRLSPPLLGGEVPGDDSVTGDACPLLICFLATIDPVFLLRPHPAIVIEKTCDKEPSSWWGFAKLNEGFVWSWV